MGLIGGGALYFSLVPVGGSLYSGGGVLEVLRYSTHHYMGQHSATIAA